MDGITIVLHPINIFFFLKKWLRDAVGGGDGVAGWMKPCDCGFKGPGEREVGNIQHLTMKRVRKIEID